MKSQNRRAASAELVTIGGPSAAAAYRKAGVERRAYRSWRAGLAGLDKACRAVVVHEDVLGPAGALEERIRELRKRAPRADVLVWAPRASPDLARRAIKSGARDIVFSDRPESLARVLLGVLDAQRMLPRLLKFDRQRSRSTYFEGLISRAPAMWDLFERCVQIGPTEAPVLILGETGTGKELLARALHRLSERRGRFVPIDCGALPRELIDAELFGVVKGSFTGATRDKPGLLRNAEGGTLFLDEIGNLPLSGQVSLLRALQESKARPVGGQRERPFDARVVAATNEPLEAAVSKGEFREDLLFRLDVIRFAIPPLRERTEDIPLLLNHFLKKFLKGGRREATQFSEGFLEGLLAHPWPGNVRELENVAQRLALLYPGRRLTARHFKRVLRSAPESAPPPARAPSPDALPFKVDLERSLAEHLDPLVERAERRYLEACLQANKGRIARTAERAGIHRRTLLRKLKRYGLDKRAYRDER